MADRRVAVLVLGDLGRSPRMLYHSQSLAEAGFVVDLIGYSVFALDSELPETILCSDKIKIRNIPQIEKLPEGSPKILFLLYAPFKVLFQLFWLFWTFLVTIDKPRFILLQNPPAIPAIFIGLAVSRICNSRLIIDWHNLGYSILALNLGEKSLIVKFAKFYERVFGRMADAHICVTEAMAMFLKNDWHFNAPVKILYDKPPKHFKRLNEKERHQIFLKLSRHIDCFKGNKSDETRFTSQGRLRNDRPALLISSTSWTADEDLQILLDAAEIYDNLSKKKDLPQLVIVITGKGPMKKYYETKINDLCLNMVTISTAWLDIEDYPMLLGCADLGISLHYSSSKLDLPMKVVDMFGCSLPVCSIDYECITELVRPNETGLLFKDAKELATCLATCFHSFPYDSSYLDRISANIHEEFDANRWEENWNQVVQPMLKFEYGLKR